MREASSQSPEVQQGLEPGEDAAIDRGATGSRGIGRTALALLLSPSNLLLVVLIGCSLCTRLERGRWEQI